MTRCGLEEMSLSTPSDILLAAGERMMKLGVMGGTFDPIHHGHLSIASEAAYQFSLDGVLFIPAFIPPHKLDKNRAQSHHRAAMVERAIAENSCFAVSRLELEREGVSYSIDTVNRLLEIYDQAVDIYFIAGADAVLDIQSWMRAEELRERCRFIAACRPGFDLAALDELPLQWRSRIFPLDNPLLDISSTDIRHRVAKGRPIKYLLPEAVEKYIFQQGLYRGDTK